MSTDCHPIYFCASECLKLLLSVPALPFPKLCAGQTAAAKLKRHKYRVVSLVELDRPEFELLPLSLYSLRSRSGE